MNADEQKREINRKIALGDSLRSICAAEDMPDKSTVFDWLAADDDFRKAYGIARTLQAESLADEIREISDDGTNDWMDRQRADGSSERVLDHEHIQRSRLRVDSRKWLAAKLAPKKYGDAVQLKHADADGDRIEMDDTTRATRAASLIAMALGKGPK